jgi:hypothetical protein
VRVAGDPFALIPSVQKIVASIDPSVAQANANTLENHVARKFATRRIGILLVGVFSGAALLLSAVGIYGILGHWVSQRTREIGIRMALGARPSSILRLVIQQGLNTVRMRSARRIDWGDWLDAVDEEYALRHIKYRFGDSLSRDNYAHLDGIYGVFVSRFASDASRSNDCTGP